MLQRNCGRSSIGRRDDINAFGDLRTMVACGRANADAAQIEAVGVPAGLNCEVCLGVPPVMLLRLLEAVSIGDLTPTEGAQVMGLVDSYRRTLEVTELEARLVALEGQRV